LFRNRIQKDIVVINCIGSANVSLSFEHINQDYSSNVDVVRKFLDTLKYHNLNEVKFINLSSAAVYGNPDKLPVNEKDSTIPLSPYGYHKLISELLLKEYSQCFGLKTLSLRIFSAYGRKQKKLLFWDIHQKIQNSQGKIELFGTGHESRDYIHVNDIAQQIILAIKHSQFKGETLNVANGIEVRISEIVELFKIYYPLPFDVQFNGKNREGDPLNWRADITTFNNWGYQCSMDINVGIKDYISWLESEDLIKG
jgi:UDP-glucose 4-epimerase